jgi:hypothetical protein
MISRLVLVSIVAALGISIPSWPELQGWMHEAHSWTASRLAAWDACERNDAYTIAAPMPSWAPIGPGSEAVPARRRCSVVARNEGETTLEAATCRPTPAFDPIIADGGAPGLADDLNRLAEGLDLRLQPAVAPRRADADGRRLRIADEVRDHLPPALDSVEQKLTLTLLQAVDTLERGSPTPTAGTPGGLPGVAVPPLSCKFTGPAPVRRRVHPPVTNAVYCGAALAGASPAAEQIEPSDDEMQAIALELNRVAEGIGQSGFGVSVAARPEPALEPIDPITALESDMPYQLNRASEGPALAPNVVAREDLPSPGRPARSVSIPPSATEEEELSRPGHRPDVGLALRLTRDAAHAWMKVLTGPSVVRMSAR